MKDECPNCNFRIKNNKETLKILKMLRRRKTDDVNDDYPILVADFECDNCEEVIHLKWNDLDKDVNVTECPECGEALKATVFLGVMKGFNLESYCFSCYNKLNSGKVGGFQK